MAPWRRLGVFISYRRSDDLDYYRNGPISYAQRLKQFLDEMAPLQNIFMDVNSIDVGLDFSEAIPQYIKECQILVAVIGPKWLSVKKLPWQAPDRRPS